jgi:hypothetical protein
MGRFRVRRSRLPEMLRQTHRRVAAAVWQRVPICPFGRCKWVWDNIAAARPQSGSGTRHRSSTRRASWSDAFVRLFQEKEFCAAQVKQASLDSQWAGRVDQQD